MPSRDTVPVPAAGTRVEVLVPVYDTGLYSLGAWSLECVHFTRILLVAHIGARSGIRCKLSSTVGSKFLTSSPILVAMSGGISPFTTRQGFCGIVFIFCGFNIKSSLHTLAEHQNLLLHKPEGEVRVGNTPDTVVQNVNRTVNF